MIVHCPECGSNRYKYLCDFAARVMCDDCGYSYVVEEDRWQVEEIVYPVPKPEVV